MLGVRTEGFAARPEFNYPVSSALTTLDASYGRSCYLKFMRIGNYNCRQCLSA